MPFFKKAALVTHGEDDDEDTSDQSHPSSAQNISTTENTEEEFSHSASHQSTTTTTLPNHHNSKIQNLLILSILEKLHIDQRVLTRLEKDGFINTQQQSISDDEQQFIIPQYLELALHNVLCNNSRTSSPTVTNNSGGGGTASTTNALNLFKPEEIIGSGGFGAVLKCEHKIDKKTYAIKIVAFNTGEAKETIGEVEILSQFHHENVVRYYHSFIIENSPLPKEFADICKRSKGSDNPFNEEYESFIVIQMEYCPKTLEGCLGTLDANTARYYLKQILLGLSYLHNNNIVHADIKPSNILIVDNKVKLTDFGLSGSTNEHKKGSLGTRRYRNRNLCGIPSDLYSLGITYFEMLSNFTDRREKSETVELLKKDPVHYKYDSNLFTSLDTSLIIEMMTNPSNAESLIDKLDKCRFFCKTCNVANIVGIDNFITHEQTQSHQQKLSLTLPNEPIQALTYLSQKFGVAAPIFRGIVRIIDKPNTFAFEVHFCGQTVTSKFYGQKQEAKKKAAEEMLELVKPMFEKQLSEQNGYTITLP